MSDRRLPPTRDEYFTGKIPVRGPALPPEQAKPTIKDRRQYDLVDACKAPPKPTQKHR